MAVNAKQLPVAAIERIVIVIMILVVHGQFGKIFGREFPCAASANPRVQLKRPLAVGVFSKLLIKLDFADEFLHLVFVEGSFFHGHNASGYRIDDRVVRRFAASACVVIQHSEVIKNGLRFKFYPKSARFEWRF